MNPSSKGSRGGRGRGGGGHGTSGRGRGPSSGRGNGGPGGGSGGKPNGRAAITACSNCQASNSPHGVVVFDGDRYSRSSGSGPLRLKLCSNCR